MGASSIWLAGVLVSLAPVTGCGPVLYYGIPQTRTYEYERRVPIRVDADPAGATIASADGVELGAAPLLLDEKVRVRRTHRSLNPGMALLGCLVDVAAFVPATAYWESRRDDTLATIGFAGGIAMLSGCIGLVVIKAYNLGLDPAYRSLQSPPLFTSATRDDEEVIARSVELVARWPGLGETRQAVALPGQRAVTLRLPRRFTFDEALVLWARGTDRPLAPDQLYRVGHAYRRLAAAGTHGAAARAVELFERYLKTEGEQPHAAEVQRLIGELRAGAAKR